MVANGNGNGSVTHVIESYDARELEHVLRQIRESKRIGSLTIHFSQGVPSGPMEWKQKTPASGYVGPLQSLLK